jgi:hypothetical protein
LGIACSRQRSNEAAVKALELVVEARITAWSMSVTGTMFASRVEGMARRVALAQRTG